MHASNPARYSSSGILIAKLSLLITVCGSCNIGISQTLFKAFVKDLFGTVAEGVLVVVVSG